MSCRIDRVVREDNLIVVCITGTLQGEHVDTLRNLLRLEAGTLAMDLKNVSLINREGVELLAVAESNGTELRNCPAYIREWVTRERADMAAERPDHGMRAREDIDDV